MAKCWMASWGGVGKFLNLRQDAFHPAECGYCEVSRDALAKAIKEFVEWSGISSYDESVPLRLEIESWETLPHHEQARLVARAAGMATDEEEDRADPPADPRSPW